ncbi:MAG: hypothetical protein OXI95_19440 [bacterium]|nr:hypothetical protein [bacterium]MDE0419088.1 hypothetical protein [bacterium]
MARPPSNRSAGKAARWTENTFLNLRTASPSERKRAELISRAMRDAFQGDYSLGIAIGIFPPDDDDDQAALNGN